MYVKCCQMCEQETTYASLINWSSHGFQFDTELPSILTYSTHFKQSTHTTINLTHHNTWLCEPITLIVVDSCQTFFKRGIRSRAYDLDVVYKTKCKSLITDSPVNLFSFNFLSWHTNLLVFSDQRFSFSSTHLQNYVTHQHILMNEPWAYLVRVTGVLCSTPIPIHYREKGSVKNQIGLTGFRPELVWIRSCFSCKD